MLAVCGGGRCSALWRLSDASPTGTDALDTSPLRAVRAAIAETPGGVLTRVECVGACAQAPLIGVADRRPEHRSSGQVAWLTTAASTEHRAGLLDWLAGDWTESAPPPPTSLLPGLFHMVRVQRPAT